MNESKIILHRLLHGIFIKRFTLCLSLPTSLVVNVVVNAEVVE